MDKREVIQQKLVEELIQFYRENDKGLLDVAMRVGKVKISLTYLEKENKLDNKILIAYPDNKILNSWVGDGKKFNIHLTNVTYVNFSSLKKYNNTKFDIFIIDEPQNLSENEFNTAMEIVNNSDKSLCLSGTFSSQLLENLKNYNFNIIATYSKEEAIQDNIVADYTLKIHLVNLDDKITTKNSKGRWVTEKQRYDAYSWVIENFYEQKKDAFNLLLARNRLSLNSIAKLKKIKELLQEFKDKRLLIFTGLSKVAESLGIPFYHSKCKNDENIKKFNNKEFNHLALVNAGKVGTNYEDLDTLILSNFTGTHEDNRQLLDRCAKLDYHGKKADLHIICLYEKAEMLKLEKTLTYLDQSKIKWILPLKKG